MHCSGLNTACDWFSMVKTQGMGLFLPDGSRLYDDEEVKDNEIVGEKLLFMDENPPTLNYVQGNVMFKVIYKVMFKVHNALEF